MTPPVRFGVAHDFRCPPGSDYTLQDVYAQTIEQIARARPARPRPGLVQRAPLRRGRLPAVVRPGRRRGRGGDEAGCGSRRTSRSSRSPTRCASPRTSPCSTSCRAAASSSASASATRRTSSRRSASPCRTACRAPRSASTSSAWRGRASASATHGKRYQFDDVRVHPGPGAARRPAAVDGGVERARASAGPSATARNVLPQGPVSLLDGWREQTVAAGARPERQAGRDHPQRSSSPTTPSATGRRCAPPSATAWRSTAGSPRRPGSAERRHVQRARTGSRSGSFVGNVDECVDELTAFVQRYGLTDVVTWGSAPGPAAGGADAVDGALRRRGRPAGALTPRVYDRRDSSLILLSRGRGGGGRR